MDSFLFIATIILIPFWIAWFSYAPWAPTRNSDIRRVMDLAKIKKDSIFYELWSWDWRTSFEIADKLWIKVIWVELNIFLYLLCIIKKNLFHRKSDITFLNKNLFNISLADADIIYTFGMPEKMWKLGEKIKNECKKGTQVISYTFPIAWLDDWIKDKPTPQELSIYIYEIK